MIGALLDPSNEQNGAPEIITGALNLIIASYAHDVLPDAFIEVVVDACRIQREIAKIQMAVRVKRVLNTGDIATPVLDESVKAQHAEIMGLQRKCFNHLRLLAEMPKAEETIQ